MSKETQTARRVLAEFAYEPVPSERGYTGQTLYVIAGRQIITRERLEVLALCTAKEFADGEEVETVLDKVRRAGGLPVLPWGAGKWWGTRGRIVTELLRKGQGESLRCGPSAHLGCGVTHDRRGACPM